MRLAKRSKPTLHDNSASACAHGMPSVLFAGFLISFDSLAINDINMS